MEQQTIGHYGSDNRAENYEDDKKMALLLREENITLYMEHILTDVEMDGNTIESGGKRESRRLLGDVILTKSDVLKKRFAEDGCVPSTWSFDVHYPDKRFYGAFHEGDGFITKDYHESFPLPYFIPYRALYSRNVANLFMAGRNVSVSHDALGTVRVMRTGGMMGEVIGYAARLCRSYDINPRMLYEDHLVEFMTVLKSIPRIKKNKLVANVYE